MNLHKRPLSALSWLTCAFTVAACSPEPKSASEPAQSSAEPGDQKSVLLKIAQERKLSTDNMVAAVSTYSTPDTKDEYVCLNSGGQAGSVIVYAVPSMRILKYIPTAAPDSAAGFHYDDESLEVARQGYIDNRPITWGDTHHPAFSETNGKYDGQFAFINDKANPRIFVMDLRDFETKQIVTSRIFRSNHGGAFVTPNTEYIIEAAQYASPIDREYRPLSQTNFNDHYRGGITYHRFDRDQGRTIPEQSFSIELPPYIQDLSDAGKGESDGFSFTNSLCTERYIGGIEAGRPPWEAGCSAADTDYLHVINWKKAAKVVEAGKAKVVNGHKVIPLEVAVQEGLLHLIPEAKSPHGVDISPDGRFIIVAGKLDTHGQVFDIHKIKDLIAKKEYAGRDAYGVPVLDQKKAMHGQVQLGLGPLHTQFDPKEGIAYTSIYIDSVVVKWDYKNLKILDKQSVHYNIGHLVSMQGDSQDPHGKYVISLNKLAIDRFNPVGPLHPQNHQLIAVDGDKLRLIYDMPLPMGEPHYTTCIDVNTLKTKKAYEVGTDSTTMKPSPVATQAGKERVEKGKGKVKVFATVSREGITPAQITVEQGDEVSFHLTNVETKPHASVVFTAAGYNGVTRLPPGRTATVRFVASQSGHFPLYLHTTDQTKPARRFGVLGVKPNAKKEADRVRRHKIQQVAHNKLMSWEVQRKRAELPDGERQFVEYGCNACHRPGREVGGPDLTDVTVRRDKAWLKRWIMEPDTMYDDPNIVPMLRRFGVEMPNQGVTAEDADKMIKYLDGWKSAGAAAKPDDHPGAAIYNKTCFACHANAVGGAPKLGDIAAWAPRIAQGEAQMIKHSVDGFQGKTGYMPPRGGCADCSDEDLAQAVKYMISKSQ